MIHQPWRRQWQPIPVFLPSESHGQRNMVGCIAWNFKESGTTEWLTHTHTYMIQQPHFWDISKRLKVGSRMFLLCLHLLEYNLQSVQFSRSVVSDSLQPHELQHARPPCPSSIPGVYSNSCPSSRWCHSAISSSVIPFSSCPQSLPASGSFFNESVLPIRWPKYWNFSFNISPSNEHPGLIFRMDWLDLLAAQGTLKSLLQHHSSKTSVLRHSAFFTVQLSHPYTTAGKTIALTRRNFVGKIMSLLLNMLSRLGEGFLSVYSWCVSQAPRMVLY